MGPDNDVHSIDKLQIVGLRVCLSAKKLSWLSTNLEGAILSLFLLTTRVQENLEIEEHTSCYSRTKSRFLVNGKVIKNI